MWSQLVRIRDVGSWKFFLSLLCILKIPQAWRKKNVPMQSWSSFGFQLSSGWLWHNRFQMLNFRQWLTHTHTHTHTIPRLHRLRHYPRLLQTAETDSMRKGDITSSQTHSSWTWVAHRLADIWGVFRSTFLGWCPLPVAVMKEPSTLHQLTEFAATSFPAPWDRKLDQDQASWGVAQW